MSNRALDGAFRKGQEAARDLKRGFRRSCPYLDYRKADGRLTYSRAFRRAWFAGFDSVRK